MGLVINIRLTDESKAGDPGINFVDNAVVPSGGSYYGPTNNTLDLGVIGASNYRWKNIRAGTDITTSGGEIGVGTESPAVAIDASSKTDAIGLPKGTTAQRPSSPVTGQFRYNTETPGAEIYDGTAWGAVGGGGSFGLLYIYEDANGGLNTDFLDSTQSLNLTDKYAFVTFNETSTAYSIDNNGNLVVTI